MVPKQELNQSIHSYWFLQCSSKYPEILQKIQVAFTQALKRGSYSYACNKKH